MVICDINRKRVEPFSRYPSISSRMFSFSRSAATFRQLRMVFLQGMSARLKANYRSIHRELRRPLSARHSCFGGYSRVLGCLLGRNCSVLDSLLWASCISGLIRHLVLNLAAFFNTSLTTRGVVLHSEAGVTENGSRSQTNR